MSFRRFFTKSVPQLHAAALQRTTAGVLVGTGGAFMLYSSLFQEIACDDDSKSKGQVCCTIEPKRVRATFWSCALSQGYGNWKETKIGLYENRIRQFSHPLKVFNYFATVKKGEHMFMTAEDFIRSIIPFKAHHNRPLQTAPGVVEFFKLADTDGGTF